MVSKIRKRSKMESPNDPRISLRDVLLFVIGKSDLKVDPLRSNLHAAFFEGFERSDIALKKVLQDKVLFNRWRNGPVSEDIDATLDDLLFYELVSEEGNSLSLSDRGRAYLTRELAKLDERTRENLEGVAKFIHGASTGG
ncbi:MAG: hypothetical protein ACTSU5_15895 [Promethearchaeota archaeon]